VNRQELVAVGHPARRRAQAPFGAASRIADMPRAAGVLARLAYASARDAGIRLGPLLRQAGLNMSQIRDRTASLRARDQIEFVELVAGALGDGLLGFHLARQCDMREGGLFYYVLASSNVLHDLFQRGARYTSIINEGIQQESLEGREIGMRLHFAGISRPRDRHQAEFWATAVVKICRELTGVRLIPNRVSLIHRREQGKGEFSHYFGCEVRFGAAVDEITFPGRLRDLPIINADAYLNRLLVTYCEEALSHRFSVGGSMRARVENAVIPLLPHGNARIRDIARGLGMSQRTLARRLAAEGLNFSGLLDQLRLDLTRHYLADEALSISQIAWLLGYQDLATFSHACKRWTGRTPTQMRAAVTAGRVGPWSTG
jgi:AraC-like DNA-binding protein